MNSTNQLLLRIMIAIVTIMGLVACGIILGGEIYHRADNKVIMITSSMLLYGITGSICYVITRKRQYNGIGILGMTVSTLGFLINLIFTLTESTNSDFLKLIFSLFFLAIGLAHICFLFYITTQNKYADITRILAIIFISLFTMLAIIRIFGSWEQWFMGQGFETYFRIIFASLILDFTATLLVVLCNQLRLKDREDSIVQTNVMEDTTNTEVPGS